MPTTSLAAEAHECQHPGVTVCEVPDPKLGFTSEQEPLIE